MPKKILPIDEMLSLYLSGVSLSALATRYKVSDMTVRARLVEAGITIRNHKSAMEQAEARSLIAKSRLGRPSWNKGRTRDKDERVAKYSNKLRGKKVSLETRLKLASGRQKHEWYDTCQKCGRKKGWSRREMCVFCAAQYRAATYPNSMKGRKLSDAHRLALWGGNRRDRQTKPEAKVQSLIELIFSPHTVYRYSGNRAFWITLKSGKHRNPDFVYRQGRKVIEVFGRYWHRNDDPAQVIAEYRAVEWDCLVVWDNELDDGLHDKIMQFTFPNGYDEGA